ncbi:MAG: DUF4240 domain-containing protein [Chloroflexi bacterium]|nr:DUF4240 domain-containing protein [Chloroflexota bacterium]
MDIVLFWCLVETTKSASDNAGDKQAELLVKELVSRPVEEVLEFERIFSGLVARADLDHLSDIADFIYGGLGDSGWWDFRAWLVGQGRDIYEQVLANPETLADIVPLNARRDIVAEPLIFVGQNAYREKTGTDLMPSLPAYPFEPLSRGESLWKIASSTEDYDRRFRDKYPRIWAKFREENTE